MNEQHEKPIPAKPEQLSCSSAKDGHCITCSDEARPARVLSVDNERGLAIVEMGHETAEIDITLLGHVAPGHTLLVHGGVALSLWL